MLRPALASSVLFTLFVPTAATGEPADPATECVYSETEMPASLPDSCDDTGDIIEVDVSGDSVADLGVPVPSAGQGVSITSLLTSGDSFSLNVTKSVAGEVRAALTGSTIDGDSEAATASTSSSSPSKCADYAYSFQRAPEDNLKILISDSVPWYSYLASTPSRNSRSAVLADLKKAAAVISNTSSPCDTRDLNPKPQSYEGDRNLAGGVNTNSKCDAYSNTDYINNVVFGAITNANVLALTCRWYDLQVSVIQGERAHRVLQADIRFNSNSYWVTTGQSCTQSYSVAGVGAHEFGHVWGMGHVAEATHGNLTMSTNSSPCEFDQVELGIGDVSGIGHLYNAL